MGHLQTCPLHLKLMPTTSLSHILFNEETRDNTFDYIFHSQLEKMLLSIWNYLIWNCSQLVVISHIHLCTIINHSLSIVNHSLSLYYCREHKPTFQIINNWWLKSFPPHPLFHQSTARTVKKERKKEKKVKKLLLFSCPIITTDLLSQLTFHRAAGKTSCSLNRFGISYLFYAFFCVFCFVFCFVLFFVLWLNSEILVKF